MVPKMRYFSNLVAHLQNSLHIHKALPLKIALISAPWTRYQCKQHIDENDFGEAWGKSDTLNVYEN